MKKDGACNSVDNDGTGSPDAAEVRRRVVQEITQLVGDAMERDWSLLPSGSAVVAGADETYERTDAPANDADSVSPIPLAGVPLGSMDELPSGRLVPSYLLPGRRLPVRMEPCYELPFQPSLAKRLLSGGPRWWLAPGPSDFTELLPDRSNPFLSRFRDDYGPYRYLETLIGGRFEITGIRPMELDPMPSEFPLSRRGRLVLLSPRNPGEEIHSPWENAGSQDFNGLSDFPAIRKLRNSLEAVDDEEKESTVRA